ncbi:hypothetical protein VUR80DRAFT_9994 [Thermomyces stellatus]
MHKVRSHFIKLLELLIKLLFLIIISLTVLMFSIAYASLLSFTLLIESLLISFPEVTKIFQFTSFTNGFLLELIFN